MAGSPDIGFWQAFRGVQHIDRRSLVLHNNLDYALHSSLDVRSGELSPSDAKENSGACVRCV